MADIIIIAAQIDTRLESVRQTMIDCGYNPDGPQINGTALNGTAINAVNVTEIRKAHLLANMSEVCQEMMSKTH